MRRRLQEERGREVVRFALKERPRLWEQLDAIVEIQGILMPRENVMPQLMGDQEALLRRLCHACLVHPPSTRTWEVDEARRSIERAQHPPAHGRDAPPEWRRRRRNRRRRKERERIPSTGEAQATAAEQRFEGRWKSPYYSGVTQQRCDQFID